MGNCIQKIIQIFQGGRVINISGKKLRELHQIAQGGYGYVILAEDVDSRKKYALKKLICQTQQQKENYRNEVQTMKKMSACKQIIGYYGSHQIQRDGFLQAYILMELAKKTVFDWISQSQKSNKAISESEIIKVLKQTALGLKEMHDLGIIHQDLKVENILLTEDGVAKLCDFGSCSTQKIIFQDMPKSKLYHYEQRFEKNTTLMYRPPQMIDLYLKYPVDDRVDIWTLGCVLFVLNYRYHPFQEEGKLSIVNANIKYKKGVVSQKMIDFMRHLLTPNPYFRPQIDEVLRIIQNWENITQIELNKVAKTIKEDEQHRARGQFQEISQGSWRNMKKDNQT